MTLHLNDHRSDDPFPPCLRRARPGGMHSYRYGQSLRDVNCIDCIRMSLDPAVLEAMGSSMEAGLRNIIEEQTREIAELAEHASQLAKVADNARSMLDTAWTRLARATWCKGSLRVVNGYEESHLRLEDVTHLEPFHLETESRPDGALILKASRKKDRDKFMDMLLGRKGPQS